MMTVGMVRPNPLELVEETCLIGFNRTGQQFLDKSD
jgi:hypothetical protein